MKVIVIKIILIILVLLFVIVAFWGFMAMAGGHNIPKETKNSFFMTLVVLSVLIGLFIYFRKKASANLIQITMNNDNETFDTWNKIASIYQDKFMNLDLYNETYDYICNAVTKRHAKLLEIGCGPGNITKYLLSKRPDFDILGIDIAPNMIELAKANNPTAQFAVMDTRQIQSLTTKYNAIIGGFCLPYLSPAERDELVAHCYNLLYENGWVYLSFVEGEPAQSGFKESSHGRVYFHYHNLDELKAQLVTTGFGEIEIFKVPYKTSETAFDIHTIVIAKKNM